LKAKELYTKDKDYIVRQGEVMIVDEFTGRVLSGRRYNEGMHQAIEAKEKVEIRAENQTLATITLQNYFRLYKRLSGMTGTAETEASEFHTTYKLGVVPIPPNRERRRADKTDLIYKTEEAKFEAVAEDIAERHEKGQPVLVGTTSVERSEYLSKLLVRLGIPHEVLNAKHHDREAAIVAQAGRKGAVTVSTNMAGRGTDIVLGGNADFMADLELRKSGLDPVDTPDEYEAEWPKILEKITTEAKTEADEVRDAGGLYVLGTERHESRRIDNQLRGRSGRQGDPGESRFYLSLGDELMRRFNAQMIETVMTRLQLPDDQPIEAKMVSRSIQSAQTQVESQNFEIRKNVLKYDEVMNEQRKVIYAERHRVMAGEDLSDQVQHMITDVITEYVHGATAGGYAEDWDFDKLWTALKTLYPVHIKWQDLTGESDDADSDQEADAKNPELTPEALLEAVLEDARAAYAKREAEITEIAGEDAMRELERRVLLSVIDRKWREHLYEMDYLKEGIGLRAMAQRDPLIEYQREGFDMFRGMLEGLKEETVGFLFNLQVEATEPEAAPAAPTISVESAQAAAAQNQIPSALRGKGLADHQPAQQLNYSGPAEDGGVERHADAAAAAAAAAGGTRRERREAARTQAKEEKKK
jgi:preprotein translocase subunit SecA